MKKFVSKICVLLFVSIITLLQFNTTTVSAEEEVTPDSTVISYYQAVVKESENVYSGFTAVSQYYYKITGDIGGQDSDGNIKDAINSRADDKYVDMSKSGVCNQILTGGNAKYCTEENNMKGSLVKLTITNHGDVTINVENGVTVTNLRFYYIIANWSNSAQLFCDSSGTLCDASKSIQPNSYNMTNWKSDNRNGGTLSFSDANIGEAFDINHKSTGAKTYDGFNIVSNMNTAYTDLASKYGAYVVTAMSIAYENVTYYLNYNIQSKTFATSGNFNADMYKNVHSCSSSDITNPNNCINYPSAVAKAAVLVKPLAEDDVKTNRGYTQIMDYMERIIIPAGKVIIILLFLVIGTSTIITIVKSSDEPEVRHASIKKFIGMFIGAVVIYLVLQFYKEIIDAVSGWFG